MSKVICSSGIFFKWFLFLAAISMIACSYLPFQGSGLFVWFFSTGKISNSQAAGRGQEKPHSVTGWARALHWQTGPLKMSPLAFADSYAI